MDRNRVARVIRTKNRSNCHAYVALSIYPITGSENVFRYWGSSWGRVPDADFLRPATNYHEPSPIITITNHIHTSTTAYTHIHAHTRNTQKITVLSLISSPARWVLLLLRSIWYPILILCRDFLPSRGVLSEHLGSDRNLFVQSCTEMRVAAQAGCLEKDTRFRIYSPFNNNLFYFFFSFSLSARRYSSMNR